MNVEKLNRLPESIFRFNEAGRGSEDIIKVCSADGEATLRLSRDEIIAQDRLATVEYFGHSANQDKASLVKYSSRIGDGYDDLQKRAWDETVLFCAAMANKSVGKEPYSNMEEVARDKALYTNATFWNTLEAISTEVIEPIFPAVMDVATSRLIEWRDGRLGYSQVVDILSNDFFLFDDDSWGSVSSKPYQYLYKAQIALTPKPYTAKTKIKWYQDIVGGEAGRYFAAFALGARSKMYAMVMGGFKKAVANTKYIPASNILPSFSKENWNKAVMAAAALNGVTRNQLVALGTLDALSNILPTIGTDGAVAGIQGMMGDELVRNGFFANVSGVDLIEAGLAVVPHTQNYDPKYISLDDEDQSNVYIFAKNGRAPMIGAIAEGSPITITYTPGKTADMSIDISMSLVLDVQPAFSSKVIKIEM